MMRIVFLAPNSMNDYVGSLVSAFGDQVETHLFSPRRYGGQVGLAKLHRFSTGNNKYHALFYFLNPYLAWKIWRQIKRLKPDVIHLVNGEGYPWALLWLYWANKGKIPVVITLHDPERHPGSFPGNFFDSINSLTRLYTLRKASKIHIHSKCFIPHVLREGVAANDIVIIPIGSIANIYLSHRASDITKESLVLFFGRLEAYKGLDFLVEVALKMQGEFRFAIAGPGNLPSALMEKINSHPSLFELHNYWLSESEVANLFQRASVGVLPYKQATQSNFPVLAAAFGVPVVATTVGAFVEDVPMVNGLLSPPGDVDAFVDAIRQAQYQIPYYPKSSEFQALSEKFVDLYQQAIHG
jgi:glycosyltransferase involved in cell wall biosynthesis